MKISTFNHIKRGVSLMLVLGILPLYLHAQTNTVELKVVDAENRSIVESATVQWKPVGAANF